MQQFNSYTWLAIDLANHAGMDKLTWDERIQWVKDNDHQLESLVPEGKTKYLYIKALDMFRNPRKSGYIMALDASASGIQIMAALGKCGVSAKTCNLINTGKREDLYGNIMNQLTNTSITRDEVKDALVPMMYGSIKAPKETFGEGTPELKAFLYAVEKTVPILGEIGGLLKQCWDSDALAHSFTLPDGHVVILPTMIHKMKRIEVFGTSFTYRWKDIGTDENSTSLLANVVHSVDAYVSREMVRRANKAGFQLAHIHDSFWTHPKYMNQIRIFYRDIVAEIAASDLLEDIVEQLTGQRIELSYTHPELYQDILESEYMLS
jgi:hypothetical protein